MGYYINPREGTKEEWLEKHGEKFSGLMEADIIWAIKEPDQSIVVLVDNGPFTAAGIAYSRKELEAFVHPDDYRPKYIYLVPSRTITLEHPEFIEVITGGE